MITPSEERTFAGWTGAIVSGLFMGATVVGIGSILSTARVGKVAIAAISAGLTPGMKAAEITVRETTEYFVSEATGEEYTPLKSSEAIVPVTGIVTGPISSRVPGWLEIPVNAVLNMVVDIATSIKYGYKTRYRDPI